MAIISVDFDSTICEEWYPDVGPLLPGAKEVINRLYRDGHIIIINTCREGYSEELAREALDMYGVLYHHFNENDPERIERYGWDSRKIGCDISIDDRDVYWKTNGGIDWKKIEKMLNQYFYETNNNMHCGRERVREDLPCQHTRR